eukprot:SAG31_NODE_19878_length_589_cov_1.163265_1_plen_59_part_00
MKGSTIDAMSDAIDGAAVMLYAVTLAYKESANVRHDTPVAQWDQLYWCPFLMAAKTDI